MLQIKFTNTCDNTRSVGHTIIVNNIHYKETKQIVRKILLIIDGYGQNMSCDPMIARCKLMSNDVSHLVII